MRPPYLDFEAAPNLLHRSDNHFNFTSISEKIWDALAKKQELESAKKKNAENQKLIYNSVKLYAKEYEQQDKELIHLKCEARLKGSFYVDPEAKLLFIIRIRGD
ncbi:hypothetical protein P3S67_005651 [Capsicum chacoense]